MESVTRPLKRLRGMEDIEKTDEFAKYDVFICHRGPDTKTGFVSCLKRDLEAAGLQSFLDCRSAGSGEDSWEHIERAIKETSIAVVIFSKSFAASDWCMRELDVMLGTPGIKVLPVFYDVRPSEVRHPRSGQLKDGFEILCTRHDKAVNEQWEGNLRKASNLMGWEHAGAQKRLEGELVSDVVGRIIALANKPLSSAVGDSVVGVKQVAEEIIWTLEKKKEVLMLGLWGMAGIGKSTLARELYNQWSRGFDSACYIEDVTKQVNEGGVVKVQQHMMQELCKINSIEIQDTSKGKTILEEILCKKRFLLVLDNVRDNDEMEYWISSKMLTEGSKCIVTSRNRSVFETSNLFDVNHAVYVHDVQGLSGLDSERVFVSHAFGGYREMKPGFKGLVSSISEGCCGVPRVLEVCGDLLKNKEEVNVWEEVQAKLNHGTIMDGRKTFECLRISYDALSPEQQETFLNIACALIREYNDFAVRVWKSSTLEICLLTEKAPITVDEMGCMKIHDHVGHMGRKIERKKRVSEGIIRCLWMPESLLRENEELQFEPAIICEQIDKESTLWRNELDNGDMLSYLKSFTEEEAEKFRSPDVPSFLTYDSNRQIVHFRRLEKPKDDEFCIELSKLHTYDDIVDKVAQKLGLEDPSRLRFTAHNCYLQQPMFEPIKYRSVERLSDMLAQYDQTSDILYFEILDLPLPEQQELKSLKIAHHSSKTEEVSAHNIRLPKESTVSDVTHDLKTELRPRRAYRKHLLSHPNSSKTLLSDDNVEEMSTAFILELIWEEIAKIENISEASLKDLDGEEAIVLCCYNANNNELEFYFRHHEDMASIVGVGLEYAKTILTKGWQVRVEETSEEDWKEAWKEVTLSRSRMWKLLKLEPCLLDYENEMISKDRVSPRLLVWELAKYFTLKKSVEQLSIAVTGVEYITTSGDLDSKSQSSSGSFNNETDTLSWYGMYEGMCHGKKKEDGDKGEDKEAGGGDKKENLVANLGPSEDIDDNKDTKVSVCLYPGGIFPDSTELKLSSLEKTICASVEFTFINQNGLKKIETIVGYISFNFECELEHGPSQRAEWIHNHMKVTFGLREYEAQNKRELDRDSFKHLDVKEGTQSTTATETIEKKNRKEIGGQIGLSGNPHGVEIKGHVEAKRTTADGNIQQFERNFSRGWNIPGDGLILEEQMDPDEHQIVCNYRFPQPKESYLNLSTSPMGTKQAVRFQATWLPLDVGENGIYQALVPYTLIASRFLEEIVPKETNSMKVLNGKVKNSQQQGPIEYLQVYNY